MNPLLSLCRITIPVLFLLCAPALMAQDSLRYYRLQLKDKGTPDRFLLPGDLLYARATEHLSQRALARRAKVLPPDQLISTADLPIPGQYLDAIVNTQATVLRMSRWLNTVMVLTDSATYERLRQLPFVESVNVMGPRGIAPSNPFGKRLVLAPKLNASATLPDPRTYYSSMCITETYGAAEWQNNMMGFDLPHRLGLAGRGVLVGVMDAGFDWRGHAALRDLNVIAEYDFVFDDTNAFDENGESGAESHGTAVMSMIGGYLRGTLVGGAPQASFILAKTEDVRMERHIEEDNFVCALEWMEAMGVDVTNTSLGYSEYDNPEADHPYSALNGKTAHASRGVNHAARLGVICVVAAGNEAGKYNYVSVPAEADSAFAIAAVDSTGKVARFSSRGFGGTGRIKPDFAGFGVGNWGASYSDSLRLTTGQGTSYASPMVAGAVAVILSARPTLTPYQVRDLLQRTSDHAASPDTAVGYGVVNVARALKELSRFMPIVGMPRVRLADDHLSIAAGTLYEGGILDAQQRTSELPTMYLQLTVRNLQTGLDTVIATQQPLSGVARWYLPLPISPFGDGIELTISSLRDGAVIRRDTFQVGQAASLNIAQSNKESLELSTLCEIAEAGPVTSISTATPNPFRQFSIIQFQTQAHATVSLTVYNTLGEEVARLMEERELDAGFHTSFFQPAGLPAGAYYYKLRVDDAVYSEQMIYVR